MKMKYTKRRKKESNFTNLRFVRRTKRKKLKCLKRKMMNSVLVWTVFMRKLADRLCRAVRRRASRERSASYRSTRIPSTDRGI